MGVHMPALPDAGRGMLIGWVAPDHGRKLRLRLPDDGDF